MKITKVIKDIADGEAPHGDGEGSPSAFSGITVLFEHVFKNLSGRKVAPKYMDSDYVSCIKIGSRVVKIYSA